ALLMLNAENARHAFDQLSGTVHTSSNQLMIADGFALGSMAVERLRSLENAAPAQMNFLGGTQGDNHFWARGFGARGTFDGDGNAAGFDHRSHGLAVGVDAQAGDWTIGGMLALTRGDSSQSGAELEASGRHFGLYAGTMSGPVALRGGLGFSSYDIESTRSIGIPGAAQVLSGDYDASAMHVFAEAGYQITTTQAEVEPYLNLTHIRAKRDAFTETGGNAALNVASETSRTSFATLGVRASAELAPSLKGYGNLGWRHAFGDVSPSLTANFDGSDAFTVFGAPVARNAAVIEAGIGYQMSPLSTLSVSYSGQISSDARNHNIGAQFAMKF
ncbi:MAG: autotransporter outer membrane beta-barrel domain-containing protein, partial [Paracoccus sp. (in: a-proteobacteria)]|nr:autotransporter outer membrane beta-barrel domain-containing protein [Paracoccus sp. (in: a-proteobacteria)]